MAKLRFDDTDYSVVVKNRGVPPKSWRWQIYRAGRSNRIGQSAVFFRAAAANKEGKATLQLVAKLKNRLGEAPLRISRHAEDWLTDQSSAGR
jgi:hypothetical protein